MFTIEIVNANPPMNHLTHSGIHNITIHFTKNHYITALSIIVIYITDGDESNVAVISF